ncbi:helix-turn-helix domain-containing protein [Peribacillus acanthi]|uniref:helix-turn-helix domain-containing protein n=1 Tax=Peribacillus acanthi TaxID=2171554 RepID=UPI000D3E5BEA|nr:helix-turn-helix domain-containing protein [Peribacillus acanthi]
MERSILYNLDPIGIGTPFVESLTSYISRLAEAHCVATGSLISRIYSPLLKKEYLVKVSKHGGNGFFDSAIGINGVGKLACEFSDLTNKLTGRSDLCLTTLQKWSNILTSRGLLKKTKSWCPICYEESRENGEVIYDPLIWSFQTVFICLKHKRPILDICGNCNKSVPIINRNTFPGYCSRCGQWLGSFSTYKESLCNVDELLSNVLLIGELLAQSHLDVASISLRESINFYVKEMFDCSPIRAAKQLKIPKTTFVLWLSGESIPSIDYLLQLCKGFGITITEFLQKEQSVKDIGISNSSAKAKEEHNHDVIRNTLIKVIADKEPISLSTLARKLGCDRKLLSRMYKTECEKIKEIYISYQQTKREENALLKITRLEEAFRILLQKGIYPSRRQVEGILGSGFLKEKTLQEKWNKLKKELSI